MTAWLTHFRVMTFVFCFTYAQAALVLCICAFVYYKRSKNEGALSAHTPANDPANPGTPAKPANPAKASVNPPPSPPADHSVKETEAEVAVVVKGHVDSPA